MLRGRYRWMICALLFVATTINYIDRQVIGLLKPDLQKLVRLDRARLRRDRLHLPARLRDRPAPGRPGDGQARGRRRASRSPSCCGASPPSRHAFADCVPVADVPDRQPRREDRHLVRARSAAPRPASRWPASCSGSARPATSRPRSRPSPSGSRRKERAFATGIFNSGTNIGALITPLMVPWIVEWWGWEGAFIVDRPARLRLAGLVAGELRPARDATRR